MKVLIKLISIGASLAAGTLARKGLEAAWRKGTGNEPPKEATNLDNPLPGVLVFALVTAVTAAAIQVLTQRATKKAMLKLQHDPDPKVAKARV
ncbi:hypothetical protein CVV68_19180 [Arthrobacter livingstonensis]|uniref:DUF4235 domain-containing protein n=1 Tax=Arthrobacter livingstonensis TaxID=670078 RepID=A0A2V5L678_9MICC|nr:DUF4235 domain-containing protein [Arthrobacter livingstonensis]PYI65233.1 hypothetical protein CVV68_19180 [Arthrobacter livingstonensis]